MHQPNPTLQISFLELVDWVRLKFILSLGLSRVPIDNFLDSFDPTRLTMYIYIFIYFITFIIFFSLIDFGILTISFDRLENLE